MRSPRLGDNQPLTSTLHILFEFRRFAVPILASTFGVSGLVHVPVIEPSRVSQQIPVRKSHDEETSREARGMVYAQH